jgi:alpha-tubulin suppressor-like RCC1 family protein
MPGCPQRRCDDRRLARRRLLFWKEHLWPTGALSWDEMKLQRIENIPPMLGVSCGCDHTLALDESGCVWTWGYGDSGRLGMGNTSHKYQPALVPSLKGMSALLAGGYHSLAFPQEGGLLVFGLNNFGQLGLNHKTNLLTPTLCPVQPALPHSFTIKSRKKSARFL